MTALTAHIPTPIETTLAVTREFVTAGKAIFTVEVPAGFAQNNGTAPHYTYKVARVESTGGDRYFVSLLTGPDNEKSYSYLGMLNPETGNVWTTFASKFQPKSWPVQILQRVLANVFGGTAVRIAHCGWVLHHEGKCCRCGRTLTTPESCRLGIGPECAKRV